MENYSVNSGEIQWGVSREISPREISPSGTSRKYIVRERKREGGGRMKRYTREPSTENALGMKKLLLFERRNRLGSRIVP